MSAYRSSGTKRIAKVRFGDRARAIRSYILGGVLVAVGVISAATLRYVLMIDLGQYCGFLAAIGIVLLARPGWGVLEIDRMSGVVRARGNGLSAQTHQLALTDVRGVAIEMNPDQRSGFVLALTLMNGRSVALAQSMELNPLKPSYEKILRFLQREGIVAEDPNVRIAGPPPDMLDEAPDSQAESDDQRGGGMRA